MQTHAFDVELDAFADQLPSFLQRGVRREAAGKVRNMRAITSCGLWEEYGVPINFRPAWLNIDAFVFGSRYACRKKTSRT
jgi:hypothetical protein